MIEVFILEFFYSNQIHLIEKCYSMKPEKLSVLHKKYLNRTMIFT